VDNPTTIGTRTEGKVLAALLQLNKTVLIPFGGGVRYDLAYDEDGKLIRVQCKTATLRNGCLEFNTRSSKRDGTNHHYDGDADLFGVYSPDLNTVYLVPVSCMGRGKGYLRVDDPKGAGNHPIRWAKDYKVT